MILCIDPGHGRDNKKIGAYDPGATSDGYAEADIALSYALTLNHLAKERGIATFLSRDSKDDSAPLGRRIARAVEARCTHLISIHLNALNGKGKGVESFYRDAGDKAFAQKVNDAVVNATGFKNRGIKSEGQSQHSRLAILGLPGPACLVELGFIDNDAERTKLLEKETRIEVCTAILDAITAAPAQHAPTTKKG